MNKEKLDKLFWREDGFPIFRHPEYGILIAGQGEFVGEKRPCEKCHRMEDGWISSSDCDQDTSYIGLWPPYDWKANAEAPYFIDDDNTTDEMRNESSWTIVRVEDLTYTGKKYKD